MSNWINAKKESPIEDGTYLVNVKNSFKEWKSVSKYLKGTWAANTITRDHSYRCYVTYWCEIEELPEEKEGLFVFTQEHKEILINRIDKEISDLESAMDIYKHENNISTNIAIRVTHIKIDTFKCIKEFLEEL